MSCPNTLLGLPACNIVPHPDRPEVESFCATCQRRFRNEDRTDWGGASIILAAILTVLVILVL